MQLRKQKQEVRKTYAVVLGQCTEPMVSRIKTLDNYEEMNNKADCVTLLQEIRRITYSADSKDNAFVSAVDTASKFCTH